MLKIWFKIFYRTQKKNLLNLFINVLGLTLGLTGLIIVLLYYSDEKSYNAWNPDKDDIYRVLHYTADEDIWETSTVLEGQKYLDEIPEVEGVYLSDTWYNDGVAVINDKNIYTQSILYGDSNFFSFFPFPVVAGSIDDFKTHKSKIALSETQAKTYFGNQNAIGQLLKIANYDVEVALVYKKNRKSYYSPDVVMHFQHGFRANWGSFSKNLFCKLRPGSSLKDVEGKMLEIFRTYSFIPGAKAEGISLGEFEERYGLFTKLERLSDIRLFTEAEGAGPEGKGSYHLIIIMFSLSVLLILISCVNFINLSIASAAQRAKEVGVKKTLGLPKSTMVLQYVLEVCIQGVLALLLSLILVECILPSFNTFLYKDISILQWDVLVNVGGIALIISILVGLIPSIYLSKFKSINVLKGNYSRSKQGIFIRNMMLALQFLISGFFLIGAMIIQMQVSYIMDKDLGFSGDQIVISNIGNPENRYKKYRQLKAHLIKHKNILAITSNFRVPGGGNTNTTNLSYLDININGSSNAMDFNYLDVMGIEMVKGRKLSEKFASDTISNVLINETAARMLGIYNDPIGKKVQIGFNGDDLMEVVGMVKDYHVTGFNVAIEPMFFSHWTTFNHMYQNMRTVQFKIEPKYLTETMDDIEDYWKEHIENDFPFEYILLNKKFARLHRNYQRQETLFVILTIVVILISLLGLFALATLTINQRLKEVAIRKTLGASVKQIVKPLMTSYIKITLYTSLVLIPIAYYVMQYWLDDFVYRIPMPWLPYIITPFILVALVIVVVGIKAFRATKVDLITYLKFE